VQHDVNVLCNDAKKLSVIESARFIQAVTSAGLTSSLQRRLHSMKFDI
jgi:hypothetical protein